jgi:hypothetical protein
MRSLQAGATIARLSTTTATMSPACCATAQNALGVLLGNGMYRALRTTPGRYTKFAGSYRRAEVRRPVAHRVRRRRVRWRLPATEHVEDNSPGPITFSSTYGGEDFDARREPQGWDRPGFDDSAWRAAIVVDGPGGALQPEFAPPVRVMHSYTPVKLHSAQARRTGLRPGPELCRLAGNLPSPVPPAPSSSSRPESCSTTTAQSRSAARAGRSGSPTRCAARASRAGIRASVTTDSATCKWRALKLVPASAQGRAHHSQRARRGGPFLVRGRGQSLPLRTSCSTAFTR